MISASKRCFLFLIAAIFCPAVIAQAIVVGLPMLEPYATQRDGEISGMYVDMLATVLNYSGIDFSIQMMPPARMIHEFQKGSLDVSIFPANKVSFFSEAGQTKEPLHTVRMMLMGRETSSREVSATMQRQSPLIAAIRGFSPEPNILLNSSVKLVGSRDQLLKMLFSGRVDYIVAEAAVTSAYAQQHDFPPLSNVLQLETVPIFAIFQNYGLVKIPNR